MRHALVGSARCAGTAAGVGACSAPGNLVEPLFTTLGALRALGLKVGLHSVFTPKNGRAKSVSTLYSSATKQNLQAHIRRAETPN